MEINWPHQLTIVDVPSNKSGCHQSSNPSNLLELISAEIISSRDPRLSSGLPPTSVYAHLDLGYGNVSGNDRDGHDDDWLIENIGDEYKEMAKNLKVRVHINPKFLPILADRAALAKRDSAIAALRSEPIGKNLDASPMTCEQSEEQRSLTTRKELRVAKDVLQNTAKDEVDMLRIRNKAASEQQIRERSNKKLNTAANEENQNQFISKVHCERIKQVHTGTNDKISTIQNETLTKSCRENLAADLANESVPRKFQKVQSQWTDDRGCNEAIVSDYVLIEEESDEAKLFVCSGSDEAKKAGVNAKNNGTANADALTKKSDKQKLQEEVLVLEKIMAEKKALQEEKKNREKMDIALISKDRPLKKISQSRNQELGEPLLKSTFTDIQFYEHSLTDEHMSLDKAIGRKHSIPTYGRHKMKTKLEHGEGKMAGISCFSKAEEKLLGNVKGDEQDNVGNQTSLKKKLSITSRPTSVKEKDKERAEEQHKLPIGYPLFSSRISDISRFKTTNPVGILEFGENSEQLSKSKIQNLSSKSDFKLSHHLDIEKQIFKEPHIKQSSTSRLSAGVKQSESSVADKITVAKSIENPGGSRFCTCSSLKATDKVCDICLENLSGSSEPIFRPLSTLSSHSVSISYSGSSIQSAGQKFETVTDTAAHGFVTQVKDVVLPVRELPLSSSSEHGESFLMRLCLSSQTQFESQFYDCLSVRSVHLEAIREWLKQKPLELLICGQLKTSLQPVCKMADLLNDVANDPLVAIYLMEFCKSADAILRESSSLSETSATGKELTADSTEMLANSLFEEFRNHLELLSEKSIMQMTEVTDPDNDQVHFDTEILRWNIAKDSSMSVLSKRHQTAGTVNFQYDGFPDGGNYRSVGSEQVLKRQEDVVRRRNANLLDKKNIGTHEVRLSRKKHASALNVPEHALPQSEEETEFKSSLHQMVEKGSNAVSQFHSLTRTNKQTEEAQGKRLDVGKVSWQNILPRGISPVQDAENKEEKVYLHVKDQGVVATDLLKHETVVNTEPQMIASKRKHLSGRDIKNSYSSELVSEPVNESKLKHFRNSTGEMQSCHYLLDKVGLSEKTTEKQNLTFDTDPLADESARNVEKRAKYKTDNLEKDINREKLKKEKKKGKAKRVEREEVKSDHLLSKPTDSKIVLSHLLSEESALIIGMNTDSNSSYQNSTVVEEEKRISLGPKDAKKIVPDVHGLLECPSEDLASQPGPLSCLPKPLPACDQQNSVCLEAAEESENIVPNVNDFNAGDVTPETSFNWAMALAMFEGENSDCRADVSDNYSSNFVRAELEEVASESKSLKLVSTVTPKNALQTSAVPLSKQSVNLRPVSLADSSLLGHTVIDEKCQSLNGNPVENLAQNAFVLFHSGMDSVFLKVCNGFELSTAEKTLLVPLEFENKPVHYALLSPAAKELYRIKVQGSGDFVYSEHSETPSSFRSGNKRKFVDSRQESGEWCKKMRKVAKEKNESVGTINKSVDDCIEMLPVTEAEIRCLSTDEDKCKKFVPNKGEDLQKLMDLHVKNRVTDVKDSSKEANNSVGAGHLLQPFKVDGGQQQFSNIRGPRFMQTLRQNQIAKRKSLKENLQTVTDNKILLSQQPLDITSVIKPEPVRTTVEETLSGDHVSPTASTSAVPSREDLDSIPLPTSFGLEEPSRCVQRASKSPATSVELAPALSSKPSDLLHCGILPSLCSTACVSGSEAAGVPPLPNDKVLPVDSASSTGNAVSASFIPPVPPNAGPVVNPEWNCQYVSPVEAPGSYTEQQIPPPGISHFASPRLPSPAGLPWRGPWPPKNLVMPREMTSPGFCPPPPGINPSVPKRLSLLRPPGNRPGLLPHPVAFPPPPICSSSCKDQTPMDLFAGETSIIVDEDQEQGNSAVGKRMYVFNKDKPVCKDISQFLEYQGAHLFDPYNINMLRNLPENVFTVFIHESDLNQLHNLPNLLRLKQNARVTFVCYKDVTDVEIGNYVNIFPSAGLVVIDDAALIACESESLQLFCDFIQLETKEKKSWAVIISPKVLAVMDKIRLENSENADDSVRLAENKRLLDLYKTSGVIQEMSGNCLQPKTSLDYSTACRFLQTVHCKNYRHFIFITDLPRSHPDSQLFLGSGIDIMTFPEFLKTFVGKSVECNTSVASSYSTQLTVKAFEDSSLSVALDSITFTR